MSANKDELAILKALVTLQHKNLALDKVYTDYIFGRGSFTCKTAIH